MKSRFVFVTGVQVHDVQTRVIYTRCRGRADTVRVVQVY